MAASHTPTHQCTTSTQGTPVASTTGEHRPLSDFRIARHLIDAKYPDIFEQDREPLSQRIFTHIDFLRAAYPNIYDVKDKRVLDLACGSTSYEDNNRGKYDPWMSRLLRYLGAHPVGIDLCPQNEESFEWHTADLTIPDALSFLDTHSFDAIYVCAFPTRKAIQHLVAKGVDWSTVRDNMLTHLARCLKPSGTIIRQFNPSDERLVNEAIATATIRLPLPCSDDEL